MFRAQARVLVLPQRGLGMTGLTKAFRQAVKWMAWVGTLTGLLSSSALVYAQGCAMCYTSAAASKAGAIHALRSGILILIVPVLVMCAGISVVIYRSRNRFCGAADWSAEQDWEFREMLNRMNGIVRPGLRENSLPSVVRSPLSVASGPGTTDH
jgi:hypothetical protein